MYGLTSDDLALVKQLLTAFKSGDLSTRGRHPRERTYDESSDHQAPEAYIGFTSGGAISSLTSVDLGTGTGDDPMGFDEPGFATCDIYKISTGGANPELQPIDKEVFVYNLSPTTIPANSYFVTVRSKFGRWITQGDMYEGSTPNRRFKLKEELEPNSYALAYLVSGESGSLQVTGIEFTVYDGMGEFEGEEGTRGMAEWWADIERWEVYQMGCDPSDGGTGTGIL